MLQIVCYIVKPVLFNVFVQTALVWPTASWIKAMTQVVPLVFSSCSTSFLTITLFIKYNPSYYFYIHSLSYTSQCHLDLPRILHSLNVPTLPQSVTTLFVGPAQQYITHPLSEDTITKLVQAWTNSNGVQKQAWLLQQEEYNRIRAVKQWLKDQEAAALRQKE